MITETAPEGFQSEVHMTEYGTDDYSEIELEYPGGCSGHCIQAIGKQLDRNARIEGSEGVITIADFSFTGIYSTVKRWHFLYYKGAI